MSDVAERLAALRARVEAAARRAGRDPADVTLVGVSKRKSAEEVAAAVRAGLRHVGESYVQEAVPKREKVRVLLEGRDPIPCWHFVGRIQRNKAREVAERFDVVESLDRESLGAELDRRAGRAGRRLDVLIQVNVSGEAQKGGADPEAVEPLLAAAADWPHLRVVGLMAIPAAVSSPEAVRPAFARLRALRDTLAGRPGGEALRELSMGMSADFEAAIAEGATLVRVGTAIFGERDT